MKTGLEKAIQYRYCGVRLLLYKAYILFTI